MVYLSVPPLVPTLVIPISPTPPDPTTPVPPSVPTLITPPPPTPPDPSPISSGTPLPHDDYVPSPVGPVGGRTRWGKAMHRALFRRSTAPYQTSSSSTSSQPTPTHFQITNTPPAPVPLVASSQPACKLSPRPRHRRRGRQPTRKAAPYHIPTPVSK